MDTVQEVDEPASEPPAQQLRRSFAAAVSVHVPTAEGQMSTPSFLESKMSG